MKCHFENCDNEANKCIKRKIIKGSVTKKSFWHCDKHSEDEINQESNQKTNGGTEVQLRQ